MSATGAKNHAQRAWQATDVEKKLDHIAKAIYELASAVAALEADVKKVKGRVS